MATNQDHVTKAIGANVRAARDAAGLSRKRLSECADVSERYLNQLEHGVANVSVGVLARVAHALDVALVNLIPAPNGSTRMDAAGGPLHNPLVDRLRGMSLRDQEHAVQLIDRYLQDRKKSIRGVALLGLRGAGKSTIGGLFSERHKVPFFSVTREIESRAGMSLNDLFNLGGPEAYRALEHEVVQSLSDGEHRIVLETAGGIVANSPAMEAILGSFKTVWLKASPEEHLSRVVRQGDMRPMHGNPKALEHLNSLLAQREQEYARADCMIDTTGRTPDACVDELDLLAAGAVVAD